MSNTIEVTDNTQQQQFQVWQDGELAILEYRWYQQHLALMHTHVPEALEGKGIGAALAKHAFEIAKTKNIQVLPYCAFIVLYLKRHPEYLPWVAATEQ